MKTSPAVFWPDQDLSPGIHIHADWSDHRWTAQMAGMNFSLSCVCRVTSVRWRLCILLRSVMKAKRLACNSSALSSLTCSGPMVEEEGATWAPSGGRSRASTRTHTHGNGRGLHNTPWWAQDHQWCLGAPGRGRRPTCGTPGLTWATHTAGRAKGPRTPQWAEEMIRRAEPPRTASGPPVIQANGSHHTPRSPPPPPPRCPPCPPDSPPPPSRPRPPSQTMWLALTALPPSPGLWGALCPLTVPPTCPPWRSRGTQVFPPAPRLFRASTSSTGRSASPPALWRPHPPNWSPDAGSMPRT